LKTFNNYQVLRFSNNVRNPSYGILRLTFDCFFKSTISCSVQTGFSDSNNLWIVSLRFGTGIRGSDLWKLYSEGWYPLTNLNIIAQSITFLDLYLDDTWFIQPRYESNNLIKYCRSNIIMKTNVNPIIHDIITAFNTVGKPIFPI